MTDPHQRPLGLWRRAHSVAALLAWLMVTSTVGLAAEPTAWQSGQYLDLAPDGAAPDVSVTLRGAEPVLKLLRTLVHRPRTSPGDSAALRAYYTVAAPAGPPVQVKETRIIRFDGVTLATLSRVVPRTVGSIGSEYQLKVPSTAAEGWYTVTTIIEPAGPAQPSPTSDQTNTAFYVEK